MRMETLTSSGQAQSSVAWLFSFLSALEISGRRLGLAMGEDGVSFGVLLRKCKRCQALGRIGPTRWVVTLSMKFSRPLPNSPLPLYSSEPDCLRGHDIWCAPTRACSAFLASFED